MAFFPELTDATVRTLPPAGGIDRRSETFTLSGRALTEVGSASHQGGAEGGLDDLRPRANEVAGGRGSLDRKQLRSAEPLLAMPLMHNNASSYR